MEFFCALSLLLFLFCILLSTPFTNMQTNKHSSSMLANKHAMTFSLLFLCVSYVFIVIIFLRVYLLFIFIFSYTTLLLFSFYYYCYFAKRDKKKDKWKFYAIFISFFLYFRLLLHIVQQDLNSYVCWTTQQAKWCC